MVLLDIITIDNTRATVKSNVFKELNTTYVRKANIIPKRFISNITSKTSESMKNFKFNLTLLPHQIIIFPMQYTQNIKVKFDDYKTFTNGQLR